MPRDVKEDSVEEIQGLYGAFTFSERLMQKIWARRLFATAGLMTEAGEPIVLLDPGRWNQQGGPDFKSARFRLGEAPAVVGDVELHLRAGDWRAHRHAEDPAHDEVRLHVVLFPPKEAEATMGRDGREIPTLVLLPHLFYDLEEYAAEDAVELLTQRNSSQLVVRMCSLPHEKLKRRLHVHAHRRWDLKAHFARLRVEKLGWAGACHATALEILGYRFNRAPLLRIAAQHPLSEWPNWSEEMVEHWAKAEPVNWSLAGVRPLNHPMLRLRQYARWAHERPDWPEALRRFGAELPVLEWSQSTREARKGAGFAAMRRKGADAIAASVVAGSRWDTLMCDGFLPLIATQEKGRDLSGIWYHWFQGDLPSGITRGLREASLFNGRDAPACHGLAQGLLGWMLADEADGSLKGGAG